MNLRRIIKWPSLLVAAVALPFMLWAVVSIRSNTTDMSQWVPDNRDVKIRYDWFVERFGIDDYVLVSWPGCLNDDPRIATLKDLLEDPQGSTSWPTEQGVPFQEITTGPEIVDEVAKFSRTSTKSAQARLLGIFAGPNDHTCLVGALSAAGRGNPAGVVEFVHERSLQAGVAAADLRMGGSVCQVTAIDTESMRSMRMLAPLSGLIAMLIAAFCLRDVRLTLIAMAIAGYAAGISLALIFYSGYALNGVMTVLPTLAFVLTLSGAVHLLNYFRDELPDGQATRAEAEAAIERAMQVGWVPCTIAMLTTSLGMASLAISGLRPVREFGMFAAAGLVLGLLLLLSLLPACLSLFAKPGNRSAHSIANDQRSLCERIADGIARSHIALTLFSLAALALIGVGLFSIESSVRLERMFRPGFRLLEDYRWIEDEIGPLTAVELVLRFARDTKASVAEQVEYVRAVHDACQNVSVVESVFSAATFLPSIRKDGGVRSTVQRSMFRKKVARSFDTFVDESLAAREPQGDQLWRVSARVPAINSPDYEQLITRLRADVSSLPTPHGQDVACEFTGSYPVIYDSQEILLGDLAESFALAFVFILPVMIITLRSVTTGLLAMLPNVAPIVIVFGGMGWLGVPVDIGIILTASVALGIAVDDTVHFLTWYQRAYSAGQSVTDSVKVAFVRCAPAMVQTTVICGLGVLIFSASTFAPAGRFAILLSLLLVSALFGDLLMLPALMISRQRFSFRKDAQA